MWQLLGSWQNGRVVVNLYKAAQWVWLERTRGGKTKGFGLPAERLIYLAAAVVTAAIAPPSEVVRGPLPVAMVDGEDRTLTISWEPYNFGTTNALIIRKQSDRSIAVEQSDVKDFAWWLLSHAARTCAV